MLEWFWGVFGSLLPLLGSALAGVLAERFLDVSGRLLKPIWYHTFGWVYRRNRRLREARHATSDELFRVGAARHAIYIRQFSPTGFREEHLVSSREADIDAANLLAESSEKYRFVDKEDLRAEVEKRVAELSESPNAWNAEKFALRHVDVSRVGTAEEPELRMGFAATDYASFQVVASHWEDFMRQGKLEELGAPDLIDVIPGASHSFGVNLTVETADDHLLLTRRSAKAQSAKDLLHISMNEGMSTEDLNPETGLPDPYVTALRGLQEELGITLEDTPSSRARITFHSLVCDVSRYEWALLGHVNLSRTPWTEQKIRDARRLGTSPDDWESSDLRFVPFTRASLTKELKDDKDWVGHGYLNLLLSGMFRLRRDSKALFETARATIGTARNSSRKS